VPEKQACDSTQQKERKYSHATPASSGAAAASVTSLFGNPCDAATGGKLQHDVDYSSSGARDLVFSRTFNSLVKEEGMLGPYWRSGYSARYITVKTDTLLSTATVRRHDGSRYYFTLINGVWTPDSDIDAVLENTASGWVYRMRDGRTETYSIAGKLIEDRSANGQTTTYNYDAGGLLIGVTDPFGQSLQFTYDATGHLASLIDPEGRSTTYTYTGANLIRVTYPDNTARIYHYENPSFPNYLTGISIDNGAGVVARLSTYAYDAAGLAVSTEQAGGQEKYTLSYDSPTQTTVTDASGNREVLTFAVNLGIKNIASRQNQGDNKTLTQTFDPNNNLTCRLDEEGRVTTYTYNATNQKLSMTEGQGGTCSAPVATSATRTTTYQYLSPTLDLATTIESPSVAGGANKKRTSITYNAQNLPVTITQSGFTPSGAAVSRSVSLTYNANGQVTGIDGPRTDVNDLTAIAYYECTTGGACGQVKSVTNAAAQTTTYDSYDAAGRLLQMTDANGLKTIYTYDARGRVATVTQTAPDASTRVTRYSYDAPGNLSQVVLPDGRTLSYAYNAANYLTAITDHAGNRIEYGYDLKGNRTSEKTFDASNTLARQVDTAFDIRNRPMEMNRGGSVTKQVWDAIGNLANSKDPNTVAANGTTATTHQYDALNRLLTTVDRLSGNTRYSYDTNNRVAQVTSPNGAVTQYTYDDLGNLLQETSADRGTTRYTYDAAGNPTTMTDARGVVASYSYDALNRLTAITYSNSPAETVAYTYDTATGCTFGLGRLCAVADAAGTGGYAYDAFGNLVTQTRVELGVTYTTRFAYDAGNRVISITYPDNRVVTYTRDSLGRVSAATTTVNGSSQPILTGRSYRPDGLMTTQTFGNGLVESRVHDLQGRLTSQLLSGADNRLYAYDANSNLTSITSASQASAYLYDALDRMTLDQYATSTLAFNYDPNSNRLGDGIGTYNYLANSNRLQTSPSGSITLDAAGNTLNDGTRSYTYNATGHVAGLSQGATSAGYVYNHQRLRTRKSASGITTVYHYSPGGELLMETTTTGTLLRSYFHVDGEPVATLEKQAGTPAEIVSDNPEAVFTGTWPTATSIAGFYGTNYRTNTKGTGKDKATWTLTVPANGSYQVDARWVAASAHASNAPYTITHAAGSTTVTKSQRTNGGQWVLLGTYNFVTSTPAKVTLTDKANGTVIADAVKLVATTQAPAVEALYYLHTDHLQTPRIATNSTQQAVWRWEGNAFGDTAPTGTATINLRFAGQYYDAESGLHYNWNRYYDPKLGRYITSDPIGLRGGLNTYLYTNNPLVETDPLGLMGSRGVTPSTPRSTVSVFGCLIGCVSTPLNGNTGPQASIEATVGSGIEICEIPKPKKPGCGDEPKPKSCGIYDPKCDNKTQPPGLPIPRRSGIGAIVGASMKADGTICIRYGLFASPPLPLPSLELGDLSE
jgi:RHS repeat-associated protein